MAGAGTAAPVREGGLPLPGGIAHDTCTSAAVTRQRSSVFVTIPDGQVVHHMRHACDARQVARIPRPVGLLAWTVGAAALHAAVPFQLSRLGGRARPASTAPAVRGAGLVTVAAGGALMAWAFAAHYQQAPRGWPVEAGLTPGYLLRQGPYRLIRNPMYAGEAIAWAGWGLVYASPAVWAGLAILGTGFAATVRWEERRLLRRFGDDYRAYLAEVPRWVPGTTSRRRARGCHIRRHAAP